MLKMKKLTFCVLCIFAILMLSGYAAEAKTAEELRNADISELAAQPKFDAREYGIITPVRDQGSTSLCWAYSAASASEASILRSGIDKNSNPFFLSPQQIGYARNNRGADPLGNTVGETSKNPDNWENTSGGTKYAAALLSTWCGPVKSDVLYDANGWENAAYKLESAIAVDGQRLNTDVAAREKMKRAIVKYGAVTFSYNYVRNADFYNPNGELGSFPHACTIIGWDDTIPAESFYPGSTTTDGGWLVKNSYFSLPYFYLSYEVTCEQIYAFSYAANEKYDYNYFYDAAASDSGIGSLMQIKQAANVFEAKGGDDNKSEWIKAISVAVVGENADCTVEIYTDVPDGSFTPDKLVPAAVKTAHFEYGGFNCIELDRPIEVKKGSKFAAVVKVSNAYITMSENEGSSYVYRGGWIASPAVRIKVFTKTLEKSESFIEFVDETKVRAMGSGIKTLVFAMYDNEKLKALQSETVNFDENNEKIIMLPKQWQKGKNIKYKAFLWNSLYDMSTDCPAAEL